MEQESFRNSIGTVDTSGKRVWVFPKKPKGRYYRYRKYVSYLLLTIFFVSPFLKIDGNQFLLFNILERRFNIFGFPFWPQDFYLFVLSMIIGVVFILWRARRSSPTVSSWISMSSGLLLGSRFSIPTLNCR